MISSGLIDPDRAATLLESRDPLLFSQRLLDAAHSVAGIQELFAYRSGDGAPQTLASSSDLDDVAERAEAYARRFHRSDPAVAARDAAAPGSGFLCRVPADAIELAAYRRLCFERPRFSEKICFGWRFADHSLVVTFYHRHSDAQVDIAQLGALAQLAITGLTGLARQLSDKAGLVDRITRRLAAAHTVLTSRECQVCARTLAGHTARQIAVDLGLGHGTVLTYRQRAYQKLGVHKASDMLPALIA